MERDWSGNYNSIWKTLGASDHAQEERAQEDFYATSPKAINLLVKKVCLPHKILEPACGNGMLSERMTELGHDVLSYDIVDRGYGGVRDFFTIKTPPMEGDYAIVTNPPYSKATEFCIHALKLVPEGSLVCMFLKTTFAEGKERYKNLFSVTPPMMVLQCVERIICAKNGDFDYIKRMRGSAVAYAWWIWRKGHKGQTTLDWV